MTDLRPLSVASFLDSFLNYEKNPSPVTRESFIKFCEDINVQYHDIVNQLPVIHIAGTKGKTSITWLLQDILTRKRYKTGTFTSPHLQEYEERICVDGIPVESEKLLYYLHQAVSQGEFPLSSNLRTVFELLFISSLKYFKEEHVDYAIYETGLGGRLDATNIFPHPRLILLTPIHKDHTRLLGNTLEKIAAEKAGVLKKGVNALSFPQIHSVRKVFIQKSKETGCSLEFIPSSTLDPEPLLSKINHQFPVNIARVQNILFLKEACRYLDISISDEEMFLLLKKMLAGRWELYQLQKQTIIFDGAHCPLSAKNLRRNIDYHFPGVPISFCFSFMKEKNYRRITEILLRPGDKCYYFSSPLPRSLSYNTYEQWFSKKYQHVPVLLNEPVTTKSFSTPVICVTGSFYHLAKVKSWLIPSSMFTKP